MGLSEDGERVAELAEATMQDMREEWRKDVENLQARIAELGHELEARPRNAEKGEICCPRCQMVFVAKNHKLEEVFAQGGIWHEYYCPACGRCFMLPAPPSEAGGG